MNYTVAAVIVYVLLLCSLWCAHKAQVRRTTHDLALVDSMTGREFEQWCANLLRRHGFRSVRVIGKSADQGGDIIAWKRFKKYVFQCKCYKGKLGNKPVQEVNAAVEYYSGDVAVVMTNSYFTKGGIDAAHKCNVYLWDRDVLERML